MILIKVLKIIKMHHNHPITIKWHIELKEIHKNQKLHNIKRSGRT